MPIRLAPQRGVEFLHARAVIVGDERRADAGGIQCLKPSAVVLVRGGLLVGGECVIDVDEQAAHTKGGQKFGCYLAVACENIVGNQIAGKHGEPPCRRGL